MVITIRETMFTIKPLLKHSSAKSYGKSRSSTSKGNSPTPRLKLIPDIDNK